MARRLGHHTRSHRRLCGELLTGTRTGRHDVTVTLLQPDGDFTTADITYRNKDGTNYSEFTTYSQELRLAGRSDKFDWLVGAFLADERLDGRADQVRLRPKAREVRVQGVVHGALPPRPGGAGALLPLFC